MVPEWLIDSGVSGNAIKVFSTLAAKFADRDTGECEMSHRRMADSAGLSVSTTRRALEELVEQHAVVVTNQTKPEFGTTFNTYTLFFSRPSSRGVLNEALPVYEQGPLSTGEQALIGEPESVQPEELAQETPSSDRPNFDTFWELYPKKKGKGAAQDKWARMSVADRRLAVDALTRHVRQPDWIKDGGKFIPYPQKWLGQKHYLDPVGEAEAVDEMGGWAE